MDDETEISAAAAAPTPSWQDSPAAAAPAGLLRSAYSALGHASRMAVRWSDSKQVRVLAKDGPVDETIGLNDKVAAVLRRHHARRHGWRRHHGSTLHLSRRPAEVREVRYLLRRSVEQMQLQRLTKNRQRLRLKQRYIFRVHNSADFQKAIRKYIAVYSAELARRGATGAAKP